MFVSELKWKGKHARIFLVLTWNIKTNRYKKYVNILKKYNVEADKFFTQIRPLNTPDLLH